jgi:gliding motility-associated lipoprotein GldD
MNRIFFVILLFFAMACKEESKPKPKGQLSLEYTKANYESLSVNTFNFLKNKAAIKRTSKDGIELYYPKMKGSIYLTYKPVNGNLDMLLKDAQKLTYEHAIKANDIAEQPYINPTKKVYGMFYQVGGNAATNAQFYATDSTKNFLVASLYFYSKPNFDSILPAADYLKNDMREIMETLKWNNQ